MDQGSARGLFCITDDAVSMLSGHNGSVNRVAISADESIVVSGGDDGTVRIWGTESGATWYYVMCCHAASAAVWCGGHTEWVLYGLVRYRVKVTQHHALWSYNSRCFVMW